MFSNRRMIAVLAPALALTVMFGATQASAGSLDHSPRWRKAAKTTSLVIPPPKVTPPAINDNTPVTPIVEDEGDDTPDGGWNPGENCNPNGNPPKAAPSPSALGAGLLLLGGAMIRRRRQA